MVLKQGIAEAANGIDIVKLSDKNFLRSLENGVRFGKVIILENILEELDAALEPILQQQVFKQGGQDMMKVKGGISSLCAFLSRLDPFFFSRPSVVVPPNSVFCRSTPTPPLLEASCWSRISPPRW